MHQEIFNQIYEQTYPIISKYVVCHCENIEDVKDILQEIYFHVYKQINKGKEMNMEYIMGIAKNKVNDYYRFSYKHKIISLFSKNNDELKLIESIPNDVDLERSIEIKCESEQIWKILTYKPVIISKVFYLYYYLEMSISEIAKELNISESNVKNYLYRTLKELRNKLER